MMCLFADDEGRVNLGYVWYMPGYAQKTVFEQFFWKYDFLHRLGNLKLFLSIVLYMFRSIYV